MYDVSEPGITQIVREDSERLLVVFSGLFAVANMAPLQFVQEAGFSKDNLIYLRDSFSSGYRRGVSVKFNSFDSVKEWCLERVKAIPHVREVFVCGGSSGAVPALLFARAVGARHAVAFGPRTIRLDIFRPESWTDESLPMNKRIRSRHRVLQHVHNLVGRVLRRPARDWVTKRDIDLTWLHHVVTTLQENSAGGQPDWTYHVYFARRNAVDAFVASRLSQCPGIHVHPLDTPPDYPKSITSKSGWDHSVIPLLRKKVPLSSCFLPIDENR